MKTLKKPAKPKVSYRICTEKELEKANVVTEFQDNAFGDFKEHGDPHIIKLGKKPVGWMQLTYDGYLNVIEILPEFQKQGIGTSVIKQLYGIYTALEREIALTESPCSELGVKLLAKFGVEPYEIY